MTSEELKRAIELLTNNQAKNRRDILCVNEAVNKLAKHVSQSREQIGVGQQERLDQTEAYRQEARERMGADRQEIRKAISSLLIANEVTRGLAQEVATELAITTSQRVTALETAREG